MQFPLLKLKLSSRLILFALSDKPGHHNFELLHKLVLPDGSILRAQLPGRPTRDCLFCDPARDGTRSCSGVVGVFNCQGAGWCKLAKKTRVHDAAPGTLTVAVTATDVDTIAQLAGPDWDGQAVLYAFKSGLRELIRLPKGAALPVTLKVLEYEVFHVCPLKNIAPNISFAPIGLLDMFNAGGAVEHFGVQVTSADPVDGDNGNAIGENRGSKARVVLRLRGCGRLGAYSSQRPLKCTLDSSDVEFGYEEETGLLTINLPVPEKEMYKWSLEIQV
ncbi:hypothetical protein BHM03_00041482 [Ensete ventricosum]|uniref:Galactinol--sucrose galactosyltransferase 2 n=1 Tax=Ensete ventricosum TaxID=4639 RepID=A0A427A771_ENSVE|nr:hypothetical protein B296_00020824 [Ensete ventricosum]RZS10282.1 hypothetical protein BHM03_00041482 [Ensete ventricosum]